MDNGRTGIGRCVRTRVGRGSLLTTGISRILVPLRGRTSMHGNGEIIGRGISLPNCIFMRTELGNSITRALHFVPGILNFLNNLSRPAPMPRHSVGHVLNAMRRARFRRGLSYPCLIGSAIGMVRNPFDNFDNIVRRIGLRGHGLGIAIGVFKHGAPLRLNFVRMRGRWNSIAEA